MHRVNRYLRDKDFDHIDHALGRPVDPLGETYRNYFATNTDGAEATAFRASEFWHEDGTRGDMAFFSVAASGRRALAEYLAEIGDPHRAFTVTTTEGERDVVATSHGAARHLVFLDASDVDPDLTFSAFLARVKSTRLARSTR